MFSILARLFIYSPELKSVAKLVSKLGKRKKISGLINDLYTNPLKLEKKLEVMTTKERREIALDINEGLEDTGQKTDFAILNSSWLLSGTFDKFTASGTGNLTLSIKKASTDYTYYGVPEVVWNAMKEAKAHAGTIFWNQYLHGGTKTSATYQKVANVFQENKKLRADISALMSSKASKITRGIRL